MTFVYNPYSGKLDAVQSLLVLDDRYVNVTGDTMTGGLTIQPTTDTLTALVVNDTDSNNVLTVDTINNIVEGVVKVDTKANVLALTPTSNAIAYATDTDRFYIFDGTNWKESAIQLSTQTSAPNMGAEQDESRQGYGSDYITGKRISHSLIGDNSREEEGAIRVVSGTFQVYANSVWNDVVINFRLREDDNGTYELEHNPIGFEWWYEVMSGNSDIIGIDGKPVVQQYSSSMGVYQRDLVVNGGTF